MDTILAYLLCLLILASTTASAVNSRRGQQSCGDKGRFISLNRTIAPLDRITASQASFAASNVYNFGFNGESSFFTTWCTADSITDHPYIEMGFTSPVLITDIICSGRTTVRMETISTITIARAYYYYVTNFTIEFEPLDNDTILSYYTTDEESQDTKYFTVPWLNAQISLDRPLLTQRIRIRPIEWMDRDRGKSFEYICLGVGLYGCLASEAAVTETTTAAERETTSTQSSTATTTDGPTADAQLIVVRDNQALAIVLPIALLTIVFNTVIVLVGVYLCYSMRGQKRNAKTDGYVGEADQTQATRSVPLSTKSLELSQSGENLVGNLEGQTTSIHVVKNIIYGSSSALSVNMEATSHDGGPVFPLANETGYEPIDHDGIDPGNDDDDTLEFNMSYGRVDIDAPPTGPLRDHVTDFELSGNQSYNPISTTPVFDDFEYSYPATHFAPVKI